MRLLFLEEIKGFYEDVPISKTLDPNSPDFFQKEIDKRMNHDYWNLPPIPGLKYEESKKLKNYYDNS